MYILGHVVKLYAVHMVWPADRIEFNSLSKEMLEILGEAGSIRGESRRVDVLGCGPLSQSRFSAAAPLCSLQRNLLTLVWSWTYLLLLGRLVKNLLHYVSDNCIRAGSWVKEMVHQIILTDATHP